MKRIKTVLVLTALFFASGAQSQSNTDSTGKYVQGVTLKCDTIRTRYYLVGSGKTLFWGCDTSLVKYDQNLSVFAIESYITAISVRNAMDQNNLTRVMSIMVCERKKQAKEVFRMIFICHHLYGREINWTEKLLNMTLSEKSK